jgi:hypothetical protein
MKTVLRFFISTTAGVAAFATVALADMHGGSMHSMSGHMRTRLEVQDNQNFTDTKYTEAFHNRARLNVDLMPTDSLRVRITPEVRHTWGSLDTARPNVDAYEAWMSWMPSDMLGIYLGRQALSYGSGRVIGVRDWGQADGIIHDAARFVINHNMGRSDLVVSKMNERHTQGTGLSDGNLFLLYNAFDLRDQTHLMSDLDIYGGWYYDPDVGGVAGTKTNYFVAGARLAGAVEMIDYELEGTAQFGKLAGVKSQKGLMADLTVGVDFMERHRVGVNAVYANSEYQTLGLADTHQFLGLADVINRQNIYSIGADAKLGLTDEFKAGIAGYYFMRANTDSQTQHLNGVTTAGTKRALGMELDLTLGYQPEEMLLFEAGYGMFKPQSGLSASPANKISHDLYLQGTLSF